MLRSHRTIDLAAELAGAENTAMRRVVVMFPLPSHCPGRGSTKTVLLSGRTKTVRFRVAPGLGFTEISGFVDITGI